jgi:hypothetical protein
MVVSPALASIARPEKLATKAQRTQMEKTVCLLCILGAFGVISSPPFPLRIIMIEFLE